MRADRIEAAVRGLRVRWTNKHITHEELAAGLRRAADQLDQELGQGTALAQRWREEAWELDERADAERDPSIVSERTRAATDPTLM